jgi:hydroxymethylbilane synthase
MVMVPQVGQGALALECRVDDDRVRDLLEAVDDPRVSPLVTAERAFLVELGGGCTQPVGANAEWTGESGANAGTITLTGMLASADGTVVLRHTGTGSDPVALGQSVARFLLEDAGGGDLGEWALATSKEPAR